MKHHYTVPTGLQNTPRLSSEGIDPCALARLGRLGVRRPGSPAGRSRPRRGSAHWRPCRAVADRVALALVKRGVASGVEHHGVVMSTSFTESYIMCSG